MFKELKEDMQNSVMKTENIQIKKKTENNSRYENIT